MNQEEIAIKLKEVQEMNLPHMTYVKYKEYYGAIWGFEETEENIKIMDEYFYQFLDPKNEYIGNGCWLCGEKSTMLRWGLAHGIAYSECCGIAYKEYHYPEDICKTKQIFTDTRINRALQYHPDTYSIEAD